MSKKRILFYSDDFKTQNWKKELEKFNCDIIENSTHRLNYFQNILYHARVFFGHFLENKKIDVFVFRYLNDSHHLRVSVEYLLRDLLTIVLCKILGTKIIWLLHNIDRETKVHYPLINNIRRKIVNKSADRVLVTDPHLMKFALNYGIKQEKLDWICFGEPKKEKPTELNKELKKKIQKFKNNLIKEKGMKNLIVGLCVSEPAKKKTHYLFADSMVGPLKDDPECCLVLVMIGNFPEGKEYNVAKESVEKSPYILYIEDSFSVNEHFIADEIDFFYRSMSDYSVAYTLYVACALGKPTITHRFGALPTIIKRENIGFIIDDKSLININLLNSIKNWTPEGNSNFLIQRSWNIGAKRLLYNVNKILA